MRKLTGYIGALIIVFALMGSILAGYALNVNGSSSVINEYERITDVSGLYSHTQEPSYIDYNPASNYIGYEQETITHNSDVGVKTYKDLQYGETVIVKPTGEMTINGLSQGIPDGAITYFFTNQFYVEKTSGGVIGITSVVGSNYSITTDITITTNGTNTTVSTTGFYVQFQSIFHNICYWVLDETYDYYYVNGRAGGNYNDVTAYFRTSNDILTLSYLTPAVDSYDPSTFTLMFTQGGGYALAGNNGVFGILPNQWIINNRTPVIDGGYQINANYPSQTDNWPAGTDVTAPGPKTLSGIWIFYPRSISNGGGIGINYTESSRVNNYPMETDYTAPVTTTRDLDLMAMSASNYMTNTAPIIHKEREFFSNYLYLYADYSLKVPNVKSYKLSDILSTVTFPANVDVVKLEMPTQITQTTYTSSYDDGFQITYDTLTNWAVFSTFGNIGANDVLDFSSLANQYALYHVDNGKCEIYNQSGVKTGTYNSAGDIYVIFLGNNDDTVRVEIRYDGSSNISHTDIDQLPARTAPFIKMTYTAGAITNIHYADITKGYAVKNNNVSNVIWNNEYTNGNIQLLFRAEDTNITYHNDIIIGDNTISIDYTNNDFSVTLNGGDPVAVGKWRNIILNIDLRTGELSAIPVRTFNSYTNVVLDTASIFIGGMVNPAPTNIIEWAPTSNSLMFNVYSTAVFMDTYGVVMVNPQLDITEYFTDLNGFYRMRLYNFSVLGSSITVNGVTADVSNNSITIDGQTVQVKDMSITYADGHAYLSDSNVNIDLGAVVNNTVSMTGAWYFETELLRGYTTQKMIYNWNWGDFILNNTQFCIMYIGIAIVALIIARHYCTLSITDYIVLIVSFAIALTVQVVA